MPPGIADPKKLTAEEAAAAEAEAKAKEAAGLEPVGAPALEFIARSLNKPKLEKKKADAPPKDEDEDEDEAIEVDKQARQKPKPVRQAAPPPPPPVPIIDEEKLGQSIGRAVAEATKKKEPEPPAPDADLSAADKKRVAVYQHMGKQDPRYKDLSEKYVTNLRKHREYAAKWEEEHPGEKYNEEDDEHADFLDALEGEVAYDEDDYIDALTDIKLDQKEQARDQKVERKLDARIGPVELQKKLAEHRPKIIENRDKVGNTFWEAMGEDYKEVIKDGQLNTEALTALKEADPDTHAIVEHGAMASEIYATETYMLDNGLTEFKGDKQITPATPPDEAAEIRRHQFLTQFATESEQRMAQRPPAKQRDRDGRMFAPRSVYNRMPAAQRAQHWTFSYEDIGFLIAARIAKQTQAVLQAEQEKFQRRAEHLGLKDKLASLPAKSLATARKAGDTTETTNGKPVSPSTLIGSRMALARNKVDISPQGGIEAWVSRALGKS